MNNHVSILLAGLLVTACATATTDTETAPSLLTADQVAKKQFPRVDFNGDGMLTPYEYKEYQKAMFAKHYDTDGDGILKIGCTVEDFSERLTKFGSQHPNLTECYRMAGASPKDFTFDDFFAAQGGWKESADVNSDGFITEDEYVASFAAQ